MDDLYRRLKDALPKLEELHKTVHSHWGIENLVYRFYSGSFKMYEAQTLTEQIVETLQSITPETSLNGTFLEIIEKGTRQKFSQATNAHWNASTQPIIEALLHATYFLDMATTYAAGEEPHASIDSGYGSGYAALRILYNRR